MKRWKWWVGLAGLGALAVVPLAARCEGGGGAPAPSALISAKPGAVELPPPVVEPIYQGGLKPGWEDTGWTDHVLDPPPARVRMSHYGGWALRKAGLTGAFGGLMLRMSVPATFPDFLEVRLDSLDATVFPRVQVGPRHLLEREGDWLRLYIPLEELNPQLRPFEKIVLRAYAPVGPEWVLFDDVGLTGVDPSRLATLAVGGGRSAGGTVKPADLAIDCRRPSHPISPLIYGIAFDNLREHEDKHQWTLGATARRWGGNAASRYNWKLGNAWNTASDYYFRNVELGYDPSYTYDSFLEANRQHGLKSALTLPMLGWVAKDTTSMSFPASRFGRQQEMDPDVPEAGNGVSPLGKNLKPGPPTLTSVPAPPEFIAEWVREIRSGDVQRGRSVHMYILDNEPMLWNSTHRDVHPRPTTYDELLEKTIAYASVIRREDKEALIAGPAVWGWTAYLYSAADVEPGRRQRADHKAHGGVPLLPWYLRKLREHEQKTGVRLLDVLDVHFYPHGDVGLGEKGETDPDASAHRIRSTRALWDPTYKDESWVDTEIRLLPRLKEWIAENYPGLPISIGEYDFGATTHMSGGLAQAEALGRFSEAGILSAFRFYYPPEKSPAYWAFRAFRDFDGQGGRFQDFYIPTRATKGTSLFASRNEAGTRLVAIALNLEPDVERDALVELLGCGELTHARVLQYVGAPSGFSSRAPGSRTSGSLGVTLPPWSITVLDMKLASGADRGAR